MLQPAIRIFQSILFLVLLCTGTIVYAQDEIVSRGIETFRQTCLMEDARSEKIYQWATDRDLKIVQGQGPERVQTKALRWEVARSGDATVLLQVIIGDPTHLSCLVYFDQQRDSSKWVEAFFLEEMKRHPNAKRQGSVSGPYQSTFSFVDGKRSYSYFDEHQSQQAGPHILLGVDAALSPPDVALLRPFATRERSYRFFTNFCLARFPDIESIGESVKDAGWRSPVAPRSKPFYSSMWTLYDPFDEMSPYRLELWRTNAFKSCKLGFDLRAAIPMEQLIRSYALVRADDPHPTMTRQPDEKIEYYSGLVGGTRALFSLRTDEARHDGELSVFVESLK